MALLHGHTLVTGTHTVIDHVSLELDGVHCLAHRIVAAKGKGDIADTTRDARAGRGATGDAGSDCDAER